jgi:hypothetical protein
MHDDLRERWLYPSPWRKMKKIGGAGETASTASHTTGYQIGRGQSASAGMTCNRIYNEKFDDFVLSRFDGNRIRISDGTVQALQCSVPNSLTIERERAEIKYGSRPLVVTKTNNDPARDHGAGTAHPRNRRVRRVGFGLAASPGRNIVARSAKGGKTRSEH